MIPAMAEVGRRFESEEYYVPELLLSARAMKGPWSCCAPCWRPAAPNHWPG